MRQQEIQIIMKRIAYPINFVIKKKHIKIKMFAKHWESQNILGQNYSEY